MALGIGEQLERGLWLLHAFADTATPWRTWERNRRPYKAFKARCERRRAKRDPECQPWYGRYNGYEL